MAAAAGSFLTNTLFGVMDHSRIEGLEKAINTQADRQHELIHIVEDSVKTQQQQAANIQALTSLTEQLTNHLKVAWRNIDGLMITQVFRHALFISNASLDRYIQIVHAAHNHRLAFGLISFEDASSVVKELFQLARYQNYHLALAKPQHLLQCPVTMVLMEDGIRLYVHVNTYSGSPLDLYKYHPWPLSAPNGLSVVVSPQNSFFAVNDEKGMHTELSDTELQTCEKFHRFFVCPHIQVLNRRNKGSCLSSLFYSHFNETMNFCPVKMMPHEDVILPFDNNVFISKTKAPISVSQRCNNGSVSHFQLATTAKVVVDSECYLDTPSFRIYSLSGIEHQFNLNHYTWPLNFTEMFQGMKAHDMAKVLQDLSKIAVPPSNPHLLDALHRLDKTSSSAYVTHWPFLTVAAIAGVSLLMGLIVVGLIYGAYRKKTRSATPSSRQFPKGYELVPSVKYLAASPNQLLYPDLSNDSCNAIPPKASAPPARQ